MSAKQLLELLALLAIEQKAMSVKPARRARKVVRRAA